MDACAEKCVQRKCKGLFSLTGLEFHGNFKDPYYQSI